MRLLLKTILCLSVVYGCTRSTPCEKEIFLLPEGLRGQIIVFFDQADGQEMTYDGDSRVYRIPPSGILKSQFKKNGGCMGDGRNLFFYEDSIAGRMPVDYFLDIDSDSIPAGDDYVLMSFLSDETKKPDFVIHLLGSSAEFKELTASVRDLNPDELLKSLK